MKANKIKKKKKNLEQEQTVRIKGDGKWISVAPDCDDWMANFATRPIWRLNGCWTASLPKCREIYMKMFSCSAHSTPSSFSPLAIWMSRPITFSRWGPRNCLIFLLFSCVDLNSALLSAEPINIPTFIQSRANWSGRNDTTRYSPFTLAQKLRPNFSSPSC